MVINADGIKPNGVTLSICSVWYSFLAMIQLRRCSCAPPAATHPMAFVQDHLNQLLRSAMSKPTEVLGNRIVRHAKIPKDLVRDSRNPRRRGRRCISSDLLRTARPFDTRFKAARVASAHRCFPSEMAKRTGRTLVRSPGLLFRPDQERLVRNGSSPK